MTSPKLEVLLEACCTSIGEGPHWDVDSQSLYFVDILQGDIYRWDSATNQKTKIHIDDTVGFVIPREQGGFVIGQEQAIAVVDWDTQKVEVLAEVEKDLKTRINDAKCDPVGRLWAGTMTYRKEDPFNLERKMGSLYCMSTDLTLTKHVGEVDISNGLAWTADDKVMYYIDSIPRKVYAYDYDIEKGTISNMRVAVDYEVTGTEGVPDGMCIDCDDKIWVACYGGSQVVRFDPITGKVMQTIKLPTKDITSVCFGGKDLDQLFITCNALKATGDPLAGSVFRVTGLGVRGRASRKFKG